MRALSRWFFVLALVWLLQLLWIYVRLASPSWGEYWSMRGLYRPGIQAVDVSGGGHLPGYVFNPLSPTGAKWAFILASGVYAAAATGLAWITWRLTEKRRKRMLRALRGMIPAQGRA